MRRWGSSLPLLLTLALVATSAAYWGLGGSNPLPGSRPPPDPQAISSYLTQARITEFDTRGQPESRLEARRVLHYRHLDRIDFEAPRLALARSQGSAPMTIKAEQASSLDNRTLIRWQRQVRAEIEGQPPQILSTAELSLRPDARLVFTDALVDYRRGPLKMRSRGLRAPLREHRVKLLNQVRGSYAPQ